MSTEYRRAARRRKGLPTWRVIRYADDFAVLVNGSEQDAAALREEIASVLAGLGLRLSRGQDPHSAPERGVEFPGVPPPVAPQAGN